MAQSGPVASKTRLAWFAVYLAAGTCPAEIRPHGAVGCLSRGRRSCHAEAWHQEYTNAPGEGTPLPDQASGRRQRLLGLRRERLQPVRPPGTGRATTHHVARD